MPRLRPTRPIVIFKTSRRLRLAGACINQNLHRRHFDWRRPKKSGVSHRISGFLQCSRVVQAKKGD
jgi:hypothetical protein